MSPWSREESLDQALARADRALYVRKHLVRESDSLNSKKLQTSYHKDKSKRDQYHRRRKHIYILQKSACVDRALHK